MFLEGSHAPEHLVADTATSAKGENFNNDADAEVYHPKDEEGSIIDEGQNPAKPTPRPEALAHSGDSASGSSDVHEEVEGHSVYIRNLPCNATIEQLKEVFKKFSPIKHGGIQVRSSKARDTTQIYGYRILGFHAEFTWSEALNFIEKREEKIVRQIEEYTQLIASIKAQIKLVFTAYKLKMVDEEVRDMHQITTRGDEQQAAGGGEHQAATAGGDTVNGFLFHPFLPFAVSSSGHRSFLILDNGNEDLCLTGQENCLSVWSFHCDSTMELDSKNDGSFNNQSESGYFD
ncbi:hypothetical protein RJT34_23180 [Clitoria ternatea]|uniref:RRM domain-containing protein n=1 Tax=Clitoria ternatea TaxID=43366 RepID=A0AAN9II63_CLITE